MKKTTVGLCLAALTISCCMNSVLRADELVMQDSFFIADETHHHLLNEHDGRTGVLIVSGALLSSPCTLETNEVSLPLPVKVDGIQERYALKLDLVGCGDGGAVTSATSQVGVDNIMVMQSALLTGVEDGVLQPNQRMVSSGRAVLHGGMNRFTYYLSEAQQQVLAEQQTSNRAQGRPYMNPRDNNALLRLRLDYE